MAKKSDQGELDITTDAISSGPVECLGMTFENDDARRDHFIELLREKLLDPSLEKSRDSRLARMTIFSRSPILRTIPPAQTRGWPTL